MNRTLRFTTAPSGGVLVARHNRRLNPLQEQLWTKNGNRVESVVIGTVSFTC